MIVYLNGNIEPELVDKLSEALNKLQKNKSLSIYLHTDGGDLNAQETILDIIDNNRDKIELIGSGFLFSAGFNIFFRATCKKRLAFDTVGMAHFIWTAVEIDQSGRAKSDFDKFQSKELKRSKKAYIEFFKELGLTSTELNDIKKGNEHYFTHERMTELLNNQNGKKTKNEAIALELERFEAKIKEFQEYLETYDVTSKTDGVMTVASKRHQEIQCQIKIMDALPTWLAGLKKLKEDSETAEPEYRGDQVPNGLMKNKS